MNPRHPHIRPHTSAYPTPHRIRSALPVHSVRLFEPIQIPLCATPLRPHFPRFPSSRFPSSPLPPSTPSHAAFPTRNAGCLCCHPKEQEDGPKPLNQRSCTDCLCLLIFIAFLSGIGFIFIFAAVTGDWNAYLYPADYGGNRCGQGDFKNRTKGFFPRIGLDLMEQTDIIYTQPWKIKLYTLCVATCPGTFDISSPLIIRDYLWNPASQMTQNFGDGTQQDWVAVLPTVDTLNRCIPRTEATTNEVEMCAYPACTSAEVTSTGATCAYTGNGEWEVCPSFATAAQCAEQKDTCAVKSTRWDGLAYSQYTQDEGASQVIAGLADSIGGIFSVIGALTEAWGQIVVGGVVAPIMIAFCFMILLRFFAKIIVYCLLLLLVVSLWLITFICYSKSGMAVGGVSADSLTANVSAFDDPVVAAVAEAEEGDRWMWTFAFWLMLVFACFVMVSLLAARKKIKVVVAIVVEATKVFATMPSLMIFPSWGVLCQAGTYAFFGCGAALLLTMKPEAFDAAVGLVDSSNQTTLDGWARMRQEQSDSTTHLLLAIYFFGFLWVVQFIQAAAWTTMSGAVAYWYFFRNDKEQQTKIPITQSFYRVMRFHVGSIAFGSAIIAICQFVRYCLLYIERHLNKANNIVLKLIFRCFMCCLYCLEKSIKFITYYGFVFVALKGDSFCNAAFNTFSFILANPVQVAMNATVTNLLTMVCVFTIPIGSSICVYYYLESNTDVLNPIYPAGATLIVAIFVTTACMNVFECVVTTIFVCCFRDSNLYKGKHMSANLRHAFGIPKPPDDGKCEEDKMVDEKPQKGKKVEEAPAEPAEPAQESEAGYTQKV